MASHHSTLRPLGWAYREHQTFGGKGRIPGPVGALVSNNPAGTGVIHPHLGERHTYVVGVGYLLVVPVQTCGTFGIGVGD
jgi:hypothetical protein